MSGLLHPPRTVAWMADAPLGWKSRDGRFRIWQNGDGWVLWDGASIVEAPGSAGVIFERVTQAKLAAATRMLRR